MKLGLSSLVPHFNTFIYILIVWFYSFGNSMTAPCYRITPDVYNRTLTRSVSSLIISIAVLYYQISMIPVLVCIMQLEIFNVDRILTISVICQSFLIFQIDSFSLSIVLSSYDGRNCGRYSLSNHFCQARRRPGN